MDPEDTGIFLEEEGSESHENKPNTITTGIKPQPSDEVPEIPETKREPLEPKEEPQEQLQRQNLFATEPKLQYQFPGQEEQPTSNLVFFHPPNEFKSQPFKNIVDVMKWIKTIEGLNPAWKNLLYQRKVHDYHYLRCMKCSAAVSFFFKEGKILIVRFNNKHDHSNPMATKQLTSTNASRPTQKKKEKQPLKSLPQSKQATEVDYDKMKLKMKVARIYGLNYYKDMEEPQIRINAELYKNATVTIDQQLKNKNYEMKYFYEEKEPLPEVLVAVSPTMLDQSKTYGDLILFNFYYNLISTRSIKKFQWAVGFFTGMSVNTEPVLLGVCLFLNETIESYEKIFYSFMELTGNYSATFMTDDQKQIIETFKKMKQDPEGRFKGIHVVNSSTLLKIIQRDTLPKNFDRYRKLFKAKSSDKFNLLLDQLMTEELNQQNLLKFKEMAHLTCFSQVPSHFVGFNCSSMIPQTLQTNLLRLVPEPTNTNNLVQALESLQLQFLSKSNLVELEEQNYQFLLSDDKLQPLRAMLDRRVMCKIIVSYIDGLMLQVKEKDQNSVQLADKEGYLYRVVRKEEGRWECECGKLKKAGIPCQHLLSVLCKERMCSYLDYINHRWFGDKQYVKDESAVKLE